MSGCEGSREYWEAVQDTLSENGQWRDASSPPPQGALVLVYSDMIGQRIAVSDGGHWRALNGTRIFVHVTHWMPLPEDPI